MKIVINKCYGGFELSKRAQALMPYGYMNRNDLALVNCVELLGKDASGSYAKLRIVEIPDDATDWEVEEYDGFEWLTYVVDGKIYHK